jgi:tetratricopeptide (TPR) repeat protein
MVKRFLILLMLSCSVIAQAQELTEKDIRAMVEKESEQKLLVQCSVLMQEGYSYYAEIIADKLLTFQPNSANYNYRKGFLMLDSHNDFEGAMKYLKVAVTDTKKNYDMYSSKEKSASVDAFYHLARCYHLNEEIALATENYSKFISAADPGSELINTAKLKIKQCEVARKEIDNPSTALVENLGPIINTDKPEFAPVVSLDGSALYFTSKRAWEDNSTDKYRDKRYNQYPEDIYVSYIDFDGSWIDPFRLDFSDGERNEATQAVSADERRIYVYQDNTGNGDIYYSDFTTNRFQEIKKLEDTRINTEYWEPHCYVTTDGQNLYFSSDRPGGFGGRDIYRVVRLPDNSWSEPINLGPSVNTPYDEDAPFVAIDNKTLYFSSNGPMSMGDFDVFVTRRDEENNWSAPINLGYPLNSTGDDIYYTTTVDGLRGFLTSARKGGRGEKDIYEIKNDFLGVNSLAVLKGQIKTLDDRPIPEDVAITVNCLDCNEENSRTVFPRLRDGVYFSSMEPCHEYELIYSFDGGKREIYREKVKTSCETDYDEIYRDITIDVRDPKNIKPIAKEEPKVDPIVDPKVDPKDPKVDPKDPKVDPKDPKVDPKDPVTNPDKNLDPVTVKDFSNPKYKHYFEYNGNKINPKKGDFKRFVKEIEKQLKSGRKLIAINVYSSASTVPTITYETNEKLSRLRAENIKYDIQNYFQENTQVSDQMTVTIKGSVVAGPAYQNDAGNRAKYRVYQYVEVITE